MEQKKLYFTSGTAVLLLYVISSIINNQSINSLFAFTAFMAGVGLVYMFYKRNKIENFMKQNSKNGSTKTNFSIDDCKDIAIDWAKNNFDGDYGNSISFSWNVATSDIAPVYDFAQEEFYKVRLFYTNYGDKNTRIYLFIDATNGEVISPKPGNKVDEDNPFWSLEEYKITRKNMGRILSMRNSEDGNVPFNDMEFSIGNNNNGSEVEE